jgi:hypothetical protein
LDRVGCHIPDDRGMLAFLDIEIWIWVQKLV